MAQPLIGVISTDSEKLSLLSSAPEHLGFLFSDCLAALPAFHEVQVALEVSRETPISDAN